MLYTAMFCFILFCGWFSMHLKGDFEKKQRWFIGLSFSVLVIVSGCRFQAGANSDIYRNYMHAYQAAFRTWTEILQSSREVLHQVLRKIIIEVFRDPQAYFFITAAFIVGAAFFTVKKYCKNIVLGVLLYFAWGGYFASNNITRQYIAVSIGLLAIKYILEEKPIKYFLCILSAIGFHTSAVVLIPIYFLSKKKFNKNILYTYILLAGILVALNGPVTQLMQRFLYSDYGSGYGSESSNALRLIWPLIILFFLILVNRRCFQSMPEIIKNNTRQAAIFNNLLNHGSILYIYFSLLSAVNMLMFSRVAAYYSQYALIFLTYGIEASENERNKRIFRIGLWLLTILWFIVMNYSGKYIPSPYIPFWEYPWRAIL